MKVYRREVEENGIVVDPLKCFHTIKVRTHKNLLLHICTCPMFRELLVMKFVDTFGNFSIEWSGKVCYLHILSSFYS